MRAITFAHYWGSLKAEIILTISSSQKHERVWLVVLCLILLLVAYLNRFVQDDAFISFRYARHLAEGHGLTWNINEPPVEGYTNFLWTVLMAVPHWLNLPVIGFSYAAGLLFFLGTLTLTWHAARYVLNDNHLALLAVFLLGTNYSFSAYATGGMETQLQTMLFMAALVVVLDLRQSADWLAPRKLLLFSAVCGLALLTRLDSAVLIGPLALLVMLNIIRQPAPLSRRLRHLIVLALPVALLVVPWLLWKLDYYGDILPNTYYVKLGSGRVWGRGFHYLSVFLLSYLWLPIIPLMIMSVRRLSAAVRWVLVPASMWLLYILYIGGDFMEFRMLVPILPILFIYLTWLFFRFVRNRYVRVFLAMLVLGGSLRHALYFPSMDAQYLATVQLLRNEVGIEQNDGWSAVGQALGDVLFGDKTITIAVNPAGVIPYYSRLPAVDIWGLNDHWIARNGIRAANRPGHDRYAPWEYLQTRKIHLFIGQPQIGPVGLDVRQLLDFERFKHSYHFDLLDPALLPPETRVVELPLGETHNAYLLYLKSHPRIDALIEAGTWKAYPIRYQELGQ